MKTTPTAEERIAEFERIVAKFGHIGLGTEPTGEKYAVVAWVDAQGDWHAGQHNADTFLAAVLWLGVEQEPDFDRHPPQRRS